MQGQQSDLITQLLADYNNYRLATADVHARRAKGEYVRTLTQTGKVGGELCKAFEKMVAFCYARGFDPRLWLYSLFKSRKWRFSPQPNQLCSVKNIARFEKVGTQAQPLLTKQNVIKY